jgi:murein L,D-transpeptidase YcbB/YkuD
MASEQPMRPVCVQLHLFQLFSPYRPSMTHRLSAPFHYFRLIFCALFLVFCDGCAQSPVKVQSPASMPAVEPPSLRQQIEGSMGGFPLMAFGIPLRTASELQEFYLARNFRLAWHDDQSQPTPQALALVQAIGRIGDDGLLPEDYHYERLRRLSLDDKGSAPDYDLLLSDAAANLGHHLLSGKVDPQSISPDWKGHRRERSTSDLLTELAEASDVAGRLDLLRPQQVRYFRLQKLLREFFDRAPEWPPLPVYPAINPGADDPRLISIRARLLYWGDLETSAQFTDNIYDEVLVAAVQKFQQRHGLDSDGVIGRKTLEALNITPAARREQIVINMERWRWLAENLGSKHLLVNIAGFELKGVVDNRTVLRKPVIVGRHYRRTPVFSDAVRYLVFNPTWTVPYKLAVRDKLPDIQKDPEYLKRLGFTVYDKEQRVVDPTTVDWSQITRRDFPYRLVQAPGPDNALGQIKFMFPNPYDVYLHDTPTRELFDKSDRAFSSGCVRVADPLELAAWLLEDEGYSREQIEAIVATGQLHTLFLKQPIPVHIEYWTAWIDGDGLLNFRSDIYQRDPPLAAALATPLYGR